MLRNRVYYYCTQYTTAQTLIASLGSPCVFCALSREKELLFLRRRFWLWPSDPPRPQTNKARVLGRWRFVWSILLKTRDFPTFPHKKNKRVFSRKSAGEGGLLHGSESKDEGKSLASVSFSDHTVMTQKVIF